MVHGGVYFTAIGQSPLDSPPFEGESPSWAAFPYWIRLFDSFSFFSFDKVLVPMFSVIQRFIVRTLGSCRFRTKRFFKNEAYIVWLNIFILANAANVPNDLWIARKSGFSCQRLRGWCARTWGSLANDYLDAANVGFSCQRSRVSVDGTNMWFSIQCQHSQCSQWLCG